MSEREKRKSNEKDLVTDELVFFLLCSVSCLTMIDEILIDSIQLSFSFVLLLHFEKILMLTISIPTPVTL